MRLKPQRVRPASRISSASAVFSVTSSSGNNACARHWASSQRSFSFAARIVCHCMVAGAVTAELQNIFGQVPGHVFTCKHHACIPP